MSETPLLFNGNMRNLKRGKSVLETPTAPNRNLITQGSSMADDSSMAILSPKSTENIPALRVAA